MQNYSEVLSYFRHCCPYILLGRGLSLSTISTDPRSKFPVVLSVSSHQIISEHLPCIDTLYTLWPMNGMTLIENRSYKRCNANSGESHHPQLRDQERLPGGSDLWTFRPAETQGKHMPQREPQKQWPGRWKPVHLQGSQRWSSLAGVLEGQAAFLLVADAPQRPWVLLAQCSTPRIWKHFCVDFGHFLSCTRTSFSGP